MNIVGLIHTREDANEIERIAKYSIVGERARYLGRIAKTRMNRRSKK